MPPSPYATKYLKVDRNSPYRKLQSNHIELTLMANNIPINPKLIKFGLDYDGYEYDFYGEGMRQLNLIRGGGYPFNPNTAYIEFEENEKFLTTTYLLTPYYNPTSIEIDENLIYYEDGEIESSSFNMKIEDLAMHSFARNKFQSHEEFYSEVHSKINSFLHDTPLPKLTHCSDEYVTWYGNDKAMIRKSRWKLSLFK